MPPLDNPQTAAPALAAGVGQAAPARDRRRLPVAGPLLVGPAVLAATAYMDPGNFAMNIAAGSRFDYRLLWVVLAGNLIAMLLQALSAKLGIATGRNLAELCRDRLSPAAVWPMWVVSELAAMATDLAELVGAGIGIGLLLDVPLLAGTAIAGAATYAVLLLQRRGFRTMEAIVAALVGVVGLCYLVETLLSRPDWRLVAYHSFVPWLGGPDSMLLAAGIIGATVMPHAIYLHSSLTQCRIPPSHRGEIAYIVRLSHLDTVLALGLAGLVNLAMMYMAASVFHGGGHEAVGDIAAAYRTLGPLLGGGAAAVFLVSLLAAGLSSSVVGTMAGQVVMQGFVGWRIPLWLRRAVTMVPALLVVAAGVDATEALIASQIALDIVLPVPILTLLFFTGRRDVMGEFASGPAVRCAAALAAAAVLLLNFLLLAQAAFLP